MTTFPPVSPPVFPTAETVFEGARATGADLITVIPAFLEVCPLFFRFVETVRQPKAQEWSRDPAKVEYLATMNLGVVSEYDIFQLQEL